MTNPYIQSSRWMKRWRLFLFFPFLVVTSLIPKNIWAHQTPGSIVLLDINPGKVTMELQLPLSELELALGQPLTKDPETLLQRLGPQIKTYLLAHIHPFVKPENPWLVNIAGLRLDKGEQVASGPPYWELVVQAILEPPPGVSTRKFSLGYDVIMHQVMNHAAFVSIRNDWESGRSTDTLAEAGVIHWDMKDNLIHPLEINLEKGSWWKGFAGMLSLGMAHIKEGTDHLMFLLVLLLPAPLVPVGKRWGSFGGSRYSIVRLLKIVTAFTVGHSATLILGALQWVRLPTQPVEIVIAFSILVSAIHALRPVFPGKEIYVAAGFGLIHGLAFAGTLANLNLSAGPMAVTILGFNIGIELMQLFVIAVTVPWLIMLSRTSAYKFIRTGGALFAGVAALAWMLQRYAGKSNILSSLVEQIAGSAIWIIIAMAVLAVSSFIWEKKKVYYTR